MLTRSCYLGESFAFIWCKIVYCYLKIQLDDRFVKLVNEIIAFRNLLWASIFMKTSPSLPPRKAWYNYPVYWILFVKRFHSVQLWNKTAHSCKGFGVLKREKWRILNYWKSHFLSDSEILFLVTSSRFRALIARTRLLLDVVYAQSKRVFNAIFTIVNLYVYGKSFKFHRKTFFDMCLVSIQNIICEVLSHNCHKYTCENFRSN